MSDVTPTGENFKEYFSSKMKTAGYDVKPWTLVEGMDKVILAENPYYIIAFQVFDLWPKLVDAAGRMELAFSQILNQYKETAKVWDTYLVLVCRSDLEADQYNQLTNLVYNTHRTRKIVRAGLGNELTRLDEVTKPFISLTKVRLTAKGRDPLTILGDKIKNTGIVDSLEIDRLIAIYKERGDLTNA